MVDIQKYLKSVKEKSSIARVYAKSNYQFIIIILSLLVTQLQLIILNNDVNSISFEVDNSGVAYAVRSLESELSNISSEISDLDRDISSLSSDISTLTSDVSSIESDVSSLNMSSYSWSSELSTIRRDLAFCKY